MVTSQHPGSGAIQLFSSCERGPLWQAVRGGWFSPELPIYFWPFPFIPGSHLPILHGADQGTLSGNVMRLATHSWNTRSRFGKKNGRPSNQRQPISRPKVTIMFNWWFGYPYVTIPFTRESYIEIQTTGPQTTNQTLVEKGKREKHKNPYLLNLPNHITYPNGTYICTLLIYQNKSKNMYTQILWFALGGWKKKTIPKWWFNDGLPWFTLVENKRQTQE